MPTNYSNYVSDSYTTLAMCPRAVAKTGTITYAGAISNFIVGTNTVFQSGREVFEGDYIWNGIDEFRKILRVDSDTELTIEKPFSASATAITPLIINPRGIRSIEWNVISGTPTINGIARVAGEKIKLILLDHADKEITPFIISAAGAVVRVDILK